MGTFYAEGGFGMIPTTLFGLLFVVSSVLALVRSERRWPLVATLAAVTFCSGVLGTCMGLVNTLRYVARTEVDLRLTVLAVGTAESLNNMVLAMGILVMGLLLAAAAAVRHLRAAPPHA